MLGCAHAHAQVFLPILDLLHAPKASISMLVFKLPDLQNAALASRCVSQLRVQLDSFSIHASASPLLLVGTCKYEAVQGRGDPKATLLSLSDALRQQLSEARLARVVENGELCFFPIENSVGFEGDATLRELVAAVESRAKALPSMQQRVPSGWLAVYDHLARELAKGQQLLSLPKVTAIALQCGLPHRGGATALTLEREVELMLSYLHALGAVCWFDLPRLAGLRELVILDPQWIIDAVSMVICNYEDDDHKRPCHKEAARKATKEWRVFRTSARLERMLLEFLWAEERFARHRRELMQLMEHFGLLIPIRGSEGTFVVPALLDQSTANTGDMPSGAPTATLHFALASSPRPDRAPFWSDGDLQGGFLPDGAFHELCGTAVGWSNHTARRFAPQLGRGFAHVKFGKDEVCRPAPPGNTYPCAHANARAHTIAQVLLERADGQPYVTATVNVQADATSAAAAAIERLRLLVSRVSERYANLRCTVLLPLADGTGELVERDALVGAEHDAELAELAERLAIWLPPREPPGRYDASLSYRHAARA